MYSDETEQKKLNGHFLILTWNINELKVFTDRLGLRDIYIAKIPHNIILFSSRIDWLIQLTEAKLNFKEFGSQWLLFNKISSESIFTNTQRITAGSSVTISRENNSISINKNNWLPALNKNEYLPVDFYNTLEKLITFPLIEEEKISLSLSGGMDSRVILSFLLKSNSRNWYTHTFGDSNQPDSIIANRIITDHHIPHEQIDLPFNSMDECLKDIKEYIAETVINNEASAILQLRNYNKLFVSNQVIIDGGFGEIWRREFFNRLLLTGHKALIGKSVKEIVPFLKYHRADIFNDDINNIMLQGCEEQISNTLAELPGIEKIGIENWVDLFAIKTRLVNFYAHEQVRLDSRGFCYMPFIQPDILANLFNVSIKNRKNGRLFRKIINRNFNHLTKYPLAKSQLSYPFWFGSVLSRTWSISAKRLKVKLYHNTGVGKLINTLAPFILDSINSSDTKECGYYNYPKLLALSNSLTNKDLNDFDMHELNWLLSFEIFRQNHNI